MQKDYSETLHQYYNPDTWSGKDHTQCTSHTIYPEAFNAETASCADVRNLDHLSACNGKIPIPVPTLVLMLMLDRASLCHGDDDHDLFLNHEVLVHITPQIYRMYPGEYTDYECLFDPFVLNITPSWTHLDILSRIVSDLVAQGKVPLELVDFNHKLNELYRRI